MGGNCMFSGSSPSFLFKDWFIYITLIQAAHCVKRRIQVRIGEHHLHTMEGTERNYRVCDISACFEISKRLKYLLFRLRLPSFILSLISILWIMTLHYYYCRDPLLLKQESPVSLIMLKNYLPAAHCAQFLDGEKKDTITFSVRRRYMKERFL